MRVEYLDEMADRLLALQRQALDLLTQIWITDTSERPVDEKMTACYLAVEQVGKELFRFQPQRMSYELLYQETFAEVLCLETVYDLIDYHLRECLKREIKMRVCKDCGRLFAVTGHGGVEYCDRPFDEKGRTCKEIGAFRVWERRARARTRCSRFIVGVQEAVRLDQGWQNHKGRVLLLERESQKEKTACEEEKIALEEFVRWLKEP